MNFLKEVEANVEEGNWVKMCMQCGVCSGSCPLGTAWEHPPQEIFAMIRAGKRDEVLRSESMTSSLTVTLSAGGSATNGTDYTRLGNTVTIPAGRASVVINITPIDDTLSEGTETVDLTLSAGSAYSVDAAKGFAKSL